MSNFRIHSVIFCYGTTVTPAGGSLQIPGTIEFAHQWSSTVTLAAINFPSIWTSTKHGVVNFVWIWNFATMFWYQWHFCLHEGICRGSSRIRSSPASYRAVFSDVVEGKLMIGIWQANKPNSYSNASRTRQMKKSNIIAVWNEIVIFLVHDDFCNSNVLFCSNTAARSVMSP